jgi:hypothetical protein
LIPPPPALYQGYGSQQTGAQIGGVTTTVPRSQTGAQQAGFGPGSIEDNYGAGASADTSANGAPAAPPTDWADVYFGSYGLPADLRGQIEALGQKYGTSNPDVFYQSALNTIRGSDWYKATYPGFAEGVRAGLFTDESGYRQYVNALNQVYRQYQGRDVTGSEAAAALASGANPQLIANQFQGDAIAQTNANDWQYLAGNFGDAGTGQLSAGELKAGGREQAGIDTPLGQLVQKRLQVAAQRAQKIFSGTLATSSLNLGPQGLNSPGLVGRSGGVDVAS